MKSKIRGFEKAILAGAAGFVIACLIFVAKGFGISDNYYSLESNARNQVVTHVKARGALLDTLIKSYEKTKAPDSLETLRLARIAAERTVRELHELEQNNADTPRGKWEGYIHIQRDILEKGLLELRAADTVYVAATISDTCTLLWPGLHLETIQLELTARKGTDRISFFRSHENFAFWVCLSLVQMAMWGLIIALLFGAAHSVLDINRPAGTEQVSTSPVWHSFIIPFVVCLLFVLCFYWLLLNGYLVDGNVYLHAFNTKLLVYAIPGYLAAAVCFTMFVFSARTIEDLFDEGADINSPKVKKAAALFKASFLSSAIILSFFVLWLGVQFQILNELPLMRWYQAASGRPYANNSFVYLVGLIHSLLLTLFYVPIRTRVRGFGLGVDDTETGKWFSKLLTILGSFLVSVSPLITGLLQKLVDHFINKG